MIQKRDDEIWNRLSARWDFVQGMLIVLTIVFTVIVVVVSFNTYEARQAVKEADTALKDIAKQAGTTKSKAEDAANTVATYPEMIGNVMEADVLISDANRELQRNDYPAAGDAAYAAILKLMPALTRVGLPIQDLVRTSLFDDAHCKLNNAAFSSASCAPSFVFGRSSGIDRLRPAICRALFAAEVTCSK